MQELTYGTVRLRGRLDHLLAAEVHGGLAAVSPGVLDVLRLGAFQLTQLGGVPDYAAVNESVELVRMIGQGRASGLVNGVLRSLLRNGAGPERFPSFDGDPAAFLSTWGSHPRWLVERWLSRASPAAVRARVEVGNRIPPLGFVPLTSLDDAVVAVASAGGMAHPAGRGSGALWVEDLDPAGLLAAVPGFIQDPGASLVGRYAVPPRHARIADLCAAPGGKALYLARDAAYVVAADRSLARSRIVRGNVQRTGLPVGVVCALAETPVVAGADLTLVDVPCSGTGTLRRHPDARWRLTPAMLATLTGVQRRILHSVKQAVPLGGLLVYSTCTLEPEENEAQVQAFLERSPEFRLEAPSGVDLPDVASDGFLRVHPEDAGFDGAFAARLRRTNR